MPDALIIGVAGQDGAYLSRFLLAKGYKVTGLARKSSAPNLWRLADVQRDSRFNLVFGDILDGGFLDRLVDRCAPAEVYNLAAMSDVAASFEIPDYTLQVNALGTARLLEVLRGYHGIRFYQASTSELFGDAPVPQNEDTVFRPRSPYAASKIASYFMVRTYRDGYGMHASNGIVFNHESPQRADCFVTQKIANFVAKWERNWDGNPLRLGNLDAKRDWSHAEDMVRGMWLMLQQPHGDDYVLASGQMLSVRYFVNTAFGHIGKTVVWDGDIGIIGGVRVIAGSDPEFLRPLDVPALQGDATKARDVLGWEPQRSFRGLVQEMVDGARARLQGR